MPLAMPLVALLIVFYTPTYIDFKTQINSLYYLDPSIKRFFLNSFTLFCWVFPVITILIMKLTKQISSIELNEQKERLSPLIFSGIYSAMLLTMLFKFNTQIILSKHLFSIAVAGILASLVLNIINFKIKISLHAAGAGLLLGFLFSYYTEQSIVNLSSLFFACILGGVVISARIKLNKHTNKELIAGFLTGFIISFVTDLVIILYF